MSNAPSEAGSVGSRKTGKRGSVVPSKRQSLLQKSQSPARHPPVERYQYKDGEGPRMMEILFEIDRPKDGWDVCEGAPFAEEPYEANEAHIEEIKEALANPHSALRLRLKDRLEKAIAFETVKHYEEVRKATPPKQKKYNTDFTVNGELGWREPVTTTGNAYWMKGYTPATAPFAGIPGLKAPLAEVTCDLSMIPGPYQPFSQTIGEHAFGVEKPSADCPGGRIAQEPEHDDPHHRNFSLWQRALPADELSLDTADPDL
eukprot:TRINITY_DN2101_c1_g1_i1.p1 TRINITY_DN2101_c1_g1~~TRINITY_DN2101_c1_g1_i1.p1  ORF type:complete len:259 (-),score=51.57 TRINITY_DN2101_c1_g1_i1:113-889(-)